MYKNTYQEYGYRGGYEQLAEVKCFNLDAIIFEGYCRLCLCSPTNIFVGSLERKQPINS